MNGNTWSALPSSVNDYGLTHAIKTVRQNNWIKNQKLIAYLKIGSALEKIRRKTKNNKEYGRLIKLHAPQASELPSPLRSDCLWFYNIVSVVPENEIADILGVRDLNDLDIGCPTVFRRQFRNKLNKSVPEKRGHYNAIGRGEILEA